MRLIFPSFVRCPSRPRTLPKYVDLMAFDRSFLKRNSWGEDRNYLGLNPLDVRGRQFLWQSPADILCKPIRCRVQGAVQTGKPNARHWSVPMCVRQQEQERPPDLVSGNAAGKNWGPRRELLALQW